MIDLDVITWGFAAGAFIVAFGLAALITVQLWNDDAAEPPATAAEGPATGRHRQENVPGTAAQHLPADDTIDLGLVTA